MLYWHEKIQRRSLERIDHYHAVVVLLLHRHHDLRRNDLLLDVVVSPYTFRATVASAVLDQNIILRSIIIIE
ncbi:hypothetical protein E2C01_030388 [Portunus trituberculatus]|uniref:Uncharacterized protein n=1 Tax=Portunus trituberculatus TaxID=210409 RepID=A0A5B7EV72_PORTR|nr:hypothetical protein [Portunus trituberculatus]